MPRKLTTNAAAARDRRVDRELRSSFRVSLHYLTSGDKVLLTEILDRCSENSAGRDVTGVALASAFETSIAFDRDDLLVVNADEYDSLLKRLEQAEKKVAISSAPAGRPKLLMFPARQPEQEAPHAS
jgi:hypothetical protein